MFVAATLNDKGLANLEILAALTTRNITSHTEHGSLLIECAFPAQLEKYFYLYLESLVRTPRVPRDRSGQPAPQAEKTPDVTDRDDHGHLSFTVTKNDDADAAVDFILPLRVNQRVVLDEDFAERFHSDVRKKLRKSQRRGFEFEFARTPAELDYFYHELYVPTMTSRHGPMARRADYGTAKDLFNRGQLLFVREMGEIVAGSLSVESSVEKGVLEGRLMGSNRPEAPDPDITTAIYHQTMLWARENKFRILDLKDGEPFINKGTFLFKRQWGAICGFSTDSLKDYVVSLKIRRMSNAVKAFLSENPILCIIEGGLVPVYFVAGHGIPVPAKRLPIPGAHPTVTFDLEKQWS